MKIIVRHLLYERWEGPCIGVNTKTKKHTTGMLVLIPQWLSDLLVKIDKCFGFVCFNKPDKYNIKLF